MSDFMQPIDETFEPSMPDYVAMAFLSDYGAEPLSDLNRLQEAMDLLFWFRVNL
jgi:hypothetical protein